MQCSYKAAAFFGLVVRSWSWLAIFTGPSVAFVLGGKYDDVASEGLALSCPYAIVTNAFPAIQDVKAGNYPCHVRWVRSSKQDLHNLFRQNTEFMLRPVTAIRQITGTWAGATSAP
ncbi:hypothetical protein BJ878DRAFT_575646 [Calycina marina]|uniref:Uncharacterized protein n=1 Tax=Calycina marina TaxID=1763456 RepID=A0A9P7Z356_9HELO|nr:hypothetical protein BJ878DRAFT_575646 [Calycina marina]